MEMQYHSWWSQLPNTILQQTVIHYKNYFSSLPGYRCSCMFLLSLLTLILMECHTNVTFCKQLQCQALAYLSFIQLHFILYSPILPVVNQGFMLFFLIISLNDHINHFKNYTILTVCLYPEYVPMWGVARWHACLKIFYWKSGSFKIEMFIS